MRLFLSLLFLVPFLVAVWGIGIEPRRLTHQSEILPSWPQETVRLAFFSDLHAGAPYIDSAYIENLVREVNARKPDLILMGGDFVGDVVIGGSGMPYEELIPLLAQLKAPMGVYSVLGNHDWRNKAPRVRKMFQASGIQVLDNESVVIRYGKNSALNLIGVGDDTSGHADLEKTFAQVDPRYPRLLFLHDPAALLENTDNFDIALGGHLHGGQIYVPGYGALKLPSRSPREWAQGWTKTPYGPLLVTNGIGTSLVPIRINAPPEVLWLTLNGSAPLSDSQISLKSEDEE